ncbi:MAG: hypothetical protein QOJ12_2950 [Thermoleophilales bacterium]|jgi:hypothetical protein|nr:hypothetical protein [Thermoleophilales bacterium]
MRRNRLAYTLATMLVVLIALPTFAYAARGNDVIRDCQDDGHIDGHYTQQDYADAQNNLPSDIDQYSDCRDAIKQAQAGGAGGGSNAGGGAGGGGGTNGTGGSPKPHAGNPALETKSGAYAPNQADKAAYDQARTQAATEATLPGGLAIPAAGDFKPAGATNSIPLPVLLALVAVGLLVAASTALVARRRLPDLTSAARRIIRR